MKNIVKITFMIISILILIFGYICVIESDEKESKVYAASNSSTSDIQLMARAINRRSKRRAI